MGRETAIDYCLPVTKVRLRATVTQTRDGVLTRSETARTAERSFTTSTVADTGRPQRLVLKRGWIQDYNVEVSLTDDGRLTSAGVETVGNLGRLLTATASVAGAVTALATGQVPLAVMVALGVASTEDDVPLGRDPGPALTDEQRVWAAYAKAFPQSAERYTALVREQVTLIESLDAARIEARQAAGKAVELSGALQKVATFAELRAANQQEIDLASHHFVTWRAGTISVTSTQYDVLAGVADLPRLVGGQLEFVNSEEGQEVEKYFENAMGGLARLGADPAVPTAGTAADDDVRLLRPRAVDLVHVEASKSGLEVLRHDQVMVMDAACEDIRLPVRKSWSGKRTLGITLSHLGALARISFGGTASAVTTAEALAATSNTLGERPVDAEKATT